MLLELTERGDETAEIFLADDSFTVLVEHMREVKGALGGMTGNKLKDLIYDLFVEEVADRKLGETIK